MIALDDAHLAPDVRSDTPHTGQVVLFAVLISALIAAASLTLGARNGYGWSLAAEMVARFSLLLFVAAMTVEPVARLIPSRATRAAARERGSLILGFVAASVLSLVCIVAPSRLGGEAMTTPAIAYSLLTGAILVVMLFSGHPATIRFLGAPAWRSLQRIATVYFWLAFALTGMSHLIGPHRPDDWHGLSLLLLVAALLVRFADTFVAHLRQRMAAG
ncbi:MAG: hypothetical protein WDM86_14675 [Rhizomicrobium sp.]